jgi:hypothetical protein
MMDLYPKLLLSTGLSFFFSTKSSEIDLFILNSIATIQMHATCYNQNNVRNKSPLLSMDMQSKPQLWLCWSKTPNTVYILSLQKFGNMGGGRRRSSRCGRFRYTSGLQIWTLNSCANSSRGFVKEEYFLHLIFAKRCVKAASPLLHYSSPLITLEHVFYMVQMLQFKLKKTWKILWWLLAWVHEQPKHQRF